MCKAAVKSIALLLLLATLASGQAQRRRQPPQKPLRFPPEYLTPLMRAAQDGRLGAVRYLVKSGVDVDERSTTFSASRR
jgi:ankyrin repeat protein